MINSIVKKHLLKTLDNVRYGSLFLSLPDGKEYYFEGDEAGPHADLMVGNWSAVKNLASRGDVGFADSYREGLWETSDLEALFSFALTNEASLDCFVDGTGLSRLRERFNYFFRLNSLKGSKRNIEAHYDLGNDFYSIWLDPTMTYSSAIYKGDRDNLVSAQLNKYDRLIDRIEASSGSVLEIGCGWGGFAERLLARTNCQVKGLTLSNQQYDYANKRLAGEAQFCLQDYRKEKGIFDTVVSIEMFEAVGIQYWKQYFEKIKSCMKRGGKALIQTITIENNRFESYCRGSDMIRSYIFPGGMLPSDEKFTGKAGESGLRVVDRFEFGKDYTRTLRNWLRNFEGAATEIRELGFDEGFMRLWRYYLASCAAGFNLGRIGVMQYELVHA